MPKGTSFSSGQPNSGDHFWSESSLSIIVVSDYGAEHARDIIHTFVAKVGVPEAVC